MKIEIWSDLVCPWCYIGKRRLENALRQFPHAAEVEIIYKSYELAPEMVTNPEVTVAEYLSERKGISLEQANAMSDHVKQLAAGQGITFNLDKGIPLNTFRGHCLLHFARANGRQAALKERLMKAYFTEALNLDDEAVLVRLAGEVGLEERAAAAALTDPAYAAAVRTDEQEAAALGISGVPFFVFDGTGSVSGAQPEEVFLRVLERGRAQASG